MYSFSVLFNPLLLICLKPNYSTKCSNSVFYFNSILKKNETAKKMEIELDKVLSNSKELKSQITVQNSD